MYTAQAFAHFIRFKPGDPRVRIAAWYEAQLGLDAEEAAWRATADFARSLARAYAAGGVTYRELGQCIGVSVSRADQLIHKGQRLQRGHEWQAQRDFKVLPDELLAKGRARRLLRQLDGVRVTLS